MGLDNVIQKHLQSMGGMNAVALRKYLADILQDRYPRNEEIIERIAAVIVTGKDLQDLGKLIADLYEVGFLKAVDNFRHLLGDAGKELKITAPPPPREGQPIFRKRSPGQT